MTLPPPPEIVVLDEQVIRGAQHEAWRNRPTDVGDMIGGRFRLTRHIAQGGCAIVFEATDAVRDEAVALKLVIRNDEGLKLLLRWEARVLERIRHPQVVSFLHASGQNEDPPYLVMELLRGKDLNARLEQAGRISLRDALRLGRKICSGLTAVHEAGVVHADLCPKGVFLASTPAGGEQVKLIDFGLAVVDGKHPKKEELGIVWGKLRYLSPEQLKQHSVDARADLYSVGLILFEAIVGGPLFAESGKHLYPERLRYQVRDPGPRLRLVPGIVPRFVELVGAATEEQPQNRPQSAAELERELAAIEGRLGS